MRISDWSSDVCSSDLPGSLPSIASFGPVHPRTRPEHMRDAHHRFRHAPADARSHRDAIRPIRSGGSMQLRGSRVRSFHRRHSLAAEVSRSARSEEHTSELQSLMRISYAVFCLKKKTKKEEKAIALQT